MKIVSTLTKSKIVEQVCELVNKYNGWARRFTPARLRATDTVYVVEIIGDIVIGVGGMKKLNNVQTEFMHLCVKPEFRRLGIASTLSRRRLEILETPVAISHIRSDNIPSVKNSLKSGFVPIKADPRRGYSLLTFARFKDNSNNIMLRNALKEILNGLLRTKGYDTAR